MNRGADVGLLDVVDLERWGELGRAVDQHRLPVALDHPVGDGGRGRDEREAELALETLLDDLQMEEPEETTAEAEPEGERRLGLVGEGGVVQAELLDRVPQGVVLGGL